MPERTPDDVRKQVIAAASDLSKNAIAVKFKLGWSTVDAILKEAGVTAQRGYSPRGGKAKPKAAPTGLQRVTIDPKAEGTAAALIGALARKDAATTAAVRIELSQAEVAALIGKLNDEQRGTLLAAGLKAVIVG